MRKPRSSPDETALGFLVKTQFQNLEKILSTSPFMNVKISSTVFLFKKAEYREKN
jgi:hypothetical protein